MWREVLGISIEIKYFEFNVLTPPVLGIYNILVIGQLLLALSKFGISIFGDGRMYC